MGICSSDHRACDGSRNPCQYVLMLYVLFEENTWVIVVKYIRRCIPKFSICHIRVACQVYVEIMDTIYLVGVMVYYESPVLYEVIFSQLLFLLGGVIFTMGVHPNFKLF